MKRITELFRLFVLLIVSGILFSSCGSSTDLTANSLEAEQLIIDEFGGNLHFTYFTILNSRNVKGSVIQVTFTKEPSSMKLQTWMYSQGLWIQSDETTLEITGDAKPEDFMLSLEELNIPNMQKMVEEAKAHLKKEKDIDNPFVQVVGISTPDSESKAESTYSIVLESENGGTNFRFIYTLEGNFESMKY